MIHTMMVTLTWLLGGLGVSGTIALIVAVVFLGPATVAAFVQPLISRFLACTPCIVAVCFVLATIGAYWLGHHEAESQCRAAELNSRIAAQNADIEAAKQAKNDETARADQIQRDADEQRRQDDEFIKRLKENPACGFDPDVGTERMHDVHAAPAQPTTSAGSPDAGTAHPRPRFRLPFPLVRDRGLPRQESSRDVAPHRQ